MWPVKVKCMKISFFTFSGNAKFIGYNGIVNAYNGIVINENGEFNA